MKKFMLLAITVMISAAMHSQNVNFSGNWKLNSSMSTLNSEWSMAPLEIIIDQKGNDLKVEKHSSFQGENFTINDKFTLDGKECINTGWQDSQKKSTAVWSSDKKSLTITTKLIMGDGGEMIIIEVYKMDKKNMSLNSKASSSYGDMEETMVYDKQ
ncbi:MAG TPA: hypothetical protein VMV47_18015 [Bacteroidales bacterium]|nr:hypothetical protein [Bacteroidales bacterium]